MELPIDNEQAAAPQEYEMQAISADPYNEDHVIFTALKTLGYPITLGAITQYTVGEHAGKGRTEKFVETTTDSEENRKIIKSLQSHVKLHGIRRVIGDIDWGRPNNFASLINGNEDEYYYATPARNYPSNRPHMDRETVMRCFMAAYDRYHERVEDGTMYFESTAPDDNDNSLYSELIQNGTEPIDPEALGIMTIKVIKDFVSKAPWLAPK